MACIVNDIKEMGIVYPDLNMKTWGHITNTFPAFPKSPLVTERLLYAEKSF